MSLFRDFFGDCNRHSFRNYLRQACAQKRRKGRSFNWFFFQKTKGHLVYETHKTPLCTGWLYPAQVIYPGTPLEFPSESTYKIYSGISVGLRPVARIISVKSYPGIPLEISPSWFQEVSLEIVTRRFLQRLFQGCLYKFLRYCAISARKLARYFNPSGRTLL